MKALGAMADSCYSGGLKNITLEDSTSAPMLVEGQKWELTDSNVHIGLVGKRLVHYKHFKANAKRANNSLISIRALEKYLGDNKAVLQSK